MSLIERWPGDPAAFIDEAENLMAETLKTPRIKAAFVVRIGDWFGPRWLGYSGKAAASAAAQAVEVTVPPFAPARVLSESYFVRDKGVFVPGPAPLVLHARQASPVHLKRQLAKLAPDTAFFWFSPSSPADPRAALMVYHPSAAGTPMGSYLGFRVSSTVKVVARLSFPKQEKPLPFVRRAAKKRIRP